MEKDNVLNGIIGTAISLTGTAISATEVQAIISSVITVLGFIFGVLLPWIIKLVTKINEAKKDGIISKEEVDDIIKTAKEASEDIKEHLPKEK